MEILLHKVCGRPASRTMTLRAAGPEDAAAFYALQNEVRAGTVSYTHLTLPTNREV